MFERAKGWARSLIRRANLKKLVRTTPRVEDPRHPAYWRDRGHRHANIMAVSYRWGDIDSKGAPIRRKGE